MIANMHYTHGTGNGLQVVHDMNLSTGKLAGILPWLLVIINELFLKCTQ